MIQKLIVLLENLSKDLRIVNIAANYAMYSLRHILQRLHELMTQREVECILNEARNVHKKDDHVDGCPLRKIPRWLEFGDSIRNERISSTHDVSTDQMRRSYYETIDVIIQSTNDRFEQKDLSFVCSIERVLLRSMLERRIPMNSLTYAMIDKDKLRMQLDGLQTILELHNGERSKKITSILSMSTIAHIFTSKPSAKLQRFKVYKIINLYYTVPLFSILRTHI